MNTPAKLLCFSQNPCPPMDTCSMTIWAWCLGHCRLSWRGCIWVTLNLKWLSWWVSGWF
jgi:hypothetical protein